MNKLAIAKLVVNLAAGVGVSKVTHDIISNNVNVDSTEDKIKVAVGSLVLGSMVADLASSYVNTRVDLVARVWQNRKSVKDTTEEIVDVATNVA